MEREEEFELERYLVSDQDLDREVWRRVKSKQAKKRRRRVWSVLAAAGAAGAMLLTVCLVPPSGGAEHPPYFGEEALVPEAWTEQEFLEWNGGRFLLPDTQKYMIEREKIRALYGGETVYAVRLNYRYNNFYPFVLILADHRAFVGPEEGEGECRIEIGGQVLTYRAVAENQYLVRCEDGALRYFLRMTMTEREMLPVLYSIFGDE